MSIGPCAPATPQHGVVIFEPGVFKTQYPAFATVSDSDLNSNFILAQLQLSNTCKSRVPNAQTRQTLLGLLVAHITATLQGANGQPPAGIVGRISTAAEGSVSVGADMGTIVYGQAYYLQTQWGALYWQSTAPYRQMRYIPPPLYNCFPPRGGRGGGNCGY